MDALVTIGSYGDLMLAELVRGRLESEGIDTFLVDDMAALSEGGTVVTQGVRVRVAQDQAEEARRLLAEIEGQDG
ncbi:MAG: DUF2007 domain-containing protein [Candidatus Hydrogenedentales bacterium]|jgi:hypothetical protein